MNALKKYFLLDLKIAFLNHGSFGAAPAPRFFAFISAGNANWNVNPTARHSDAGGWHPCSWSDFDEFGDHRCRFLRGKSAQVVVRAQGRVSDGLVTAWPAKPSLAFGR